MSKIGRDDFTKPTIEALAKRAGYLCSNPDCRQSTIGANEIENKSTSIGVAAHMTAAAGGGPRYNSELTADQRSDIINGIWLCSNCATLIDKDPEKYTINLLHEWKGGVEAESRLKLNGAFKVTPEPKRGDGYNPIIEVDFGGQGRGRSPKGLSMKNPTEMYEGELVMVPGNKPIIHWEMNWRYKLMIYNNSNYPAYNVKIENISDVHFSEFEQLSKINNIPPLASKELNIKYIDRIESTHIDADALLTPRYPEKFNEKLVLKLTYYDEVRKEHISYVEFKNGEISNRKVTG